jgi:hypothetical protein
MVKKLRIRESHLNENVITDLRKILKDLAPYYRKLADDWFRNSNINIEDCSLVNIPKPKGPTIAKKSEWPIIAMDEDGGVYWFGNEDYKQMRTNYPYDELKQNKAFANAVEFWQVVPNDVDTYQSRSDRKNTKTPGKFIDINKFDGSTRRGWRPGVYDKPTSGTRFVSVEEMDLYDPTVNKRKYKDILANMGQERYVKIYNNLCNELVEINERIHSIDLNNLLGYDTYDSNQTDYRTSAGHYQAALNMYWQTIDAFEALHRDIKQLGRYGEAGAWEYREIKSDINTIKRRLLEVNKELDKI